MHFPDSFFDPEDSDPGLDPEDPDDEVEQTTQLISSTENAII